MTEKGVPARSARASSVSSSLSNASLFLRPVSGSVSAASESLPINWVTLSRTERSSTAAGNRMATSVSQLPATASDGAEAIRTAR